MSIENVYRIINERILDNIKNGTPLCFEEHDFGPDWQFIEEAKNSYRSEGYIFSSFINWFSMKYDPVAAADPNLYYQGEIKPIFKKEKSDVV